MTMTVSHAHVTHGTSGRKGEKVCSVTFGPALLHTNTSEPTMLSNIVEEEDPVEGQVQEVP